MNAPDKTKIGRLALRHEGDSWNAYYAMPDTMKDAIWLGSIKMAFVSGGVRQIQRKKVFMDLMRECVADILEKEVGVRPTWGGEVIAPEHERTKE